jgi:glycolate oxidase iron-sulfur subunit
MDITKSYDEIAQCNKCGFCQVACPIFRATGHESGVARGRLALLRAIIEKRLEWTKEIEEPLYHCLLCGSCTANCFSAIPTAELMVKARSQYLEQVGRKPLHRLLFDHLLPYPSRLHLAARLAAFGKNSGLSKVTRALGLLRIFGRDFPHADDLVERLPTKAFRDNIKPGDIQGEGEKLHIGYFIGCGVDVIQQPTGHATLRFLKNIAKTVTILENCCCGLPAWFYGDIPAAQNFAEKNLNTLSEQQFDYIVTDCSSCASFLKKYPTLFPENDPRLEKAKAISSQLKDVVELIASMGKPISTKGNITTVTYHDPCHASRGQNLTKETREILKNLSEFAYIEMPEADWCCGGAGSYALSHYELSQSVLDRKMENLKMTKADLLVTSCPACMIQLSYGIRKHGLKTQVRHISEIISPA